MPLTLALPEGSDHKLLWPALPGSSLTLALAQAAERHPGPVLIITETSQQAMQLDAELAFFVESRLPILLFPDWETLPYDRFSPHQDIISQRLLALHRLPKLQQGLVLAPISSLLLKLPAVGYLNSHSFVLEKGERLQLEPMRQQLEHQGYRCVSQVFEHGEFAVRGSILDLFPMGSSLPYRIDLLDDEVDSIRTFEPDSQRSLDQQEFIRVLPAREFPFDEPAIGRFRQAFREEFTQAIDKQSLYHDVSRGALPAGIEYYLPLFFETGQLAGIDQYLPANTLIIQLGDLAGSGRHYWQEIEHRYQQHSLDPARPLLAPARVFWRVDELLQRCKAFGRIQTALNPPVDAQAAIRLPPPLLLDHQQAQPLAALQQFLTEYSGSVLLTAESPGRLQSLMSLLQRHQLSASLLDTWSQFLQQQPRLGLVQAELERGLWLDDWCLITENELFGQQVMQRRRRQRKTDPDQLIKSLLELSPGDPVVHREQGIGRYLGLETLEINQQQNEFVKLEYLHGDLLYVPVSALHLLNRYSGGAADQAPISRLGSGQWDKARRKAAEKIRDVAAELLDTYARREARQGIAFDIDESYPRFAAGFKFETTPDQQQAIEQVLADMQAPRPMDRLICGDVGFGKTEVALRAAFVAATAGYQVVVLAPTTLLVEQHWQTFVDRFTDWPIRIEALSRFRSSKQQQSILAAVRDGLVDILIGTHKILNQPEFKRLGLMIIDEEHRFGVRQKEQLKALRSEVDILTLTATPIPRTLNMAMAGLRELSIIATPPARRLAIKTFVRERDLPLIREAVLREIFRGGQVYYLHNDVDSIERTQRELQQLLPEASFQIAHGQMPESQLERIMSDFYHGRFQVLLCTTIIETGIDVPNANTIILDRADKLGLAQLHQLRGRVGRSHHQAYAYLLTPPVKLLTADAVKRLEAIENLEDLGAGFSLATQDLEIRGAGELLGDDQSGQVESIGFSLYMELLDEAMAALKAGRDIPVNLSLKAGCELELQIPALLPEDYIRDVNIRLRLYKRLASCTSQTDIDELQVELIDRFGLLPEPAKNLIRLAELGLDAKRLDIKKVELTARGGFIEFHPEPKIEPMQLIRLVQKQPKRFSLAPDRLKISQTTDSAAQRIELLGQLFQDIQS